MTILISCKHKVNLSYIMIAIATFDELMLHVMYVACHFRKYLCGLKRVLNVYGKHEGPKKLIGDEVQVFSVSSTTPPRHF